MIDQTLAQLSERQLEASYKKLTSLRLAAEAEVSSNRTVTLELATLLIPDVLSKIAIADPRAIERLSTNGIITLIRENVLPLRTLLEIGERVETDVSALIMRRDTELRDLRARLAKVPEQNIPGTLPGAPTLVKRDEPVSTTRVVQNPRAELMAAVRHGEPRGNVLMRRLKLTADAFQQLLKDPAFVTYPIDEVNDVLVDLKAEATLVQARLAKVKSPTILYLAHWTIESLAGSTWNEEIIEDYLCLIKKGPHIILLVAPDYQPSIEVIEEVLYRQDNAAYIVAITKDASVETANNVRDIYYTKPLPKVDIYSTYAEYLISGLRHSINKTIWVQEKNIVRNKDAQP